MSLMYIPRQRSPWEQMLPGFVQNLMVNQMAAKRQDARITAAQELAQTNLQEQRKYAERQKVLGEETEMAVAGHVPENITMGGANPFNQPAPEGYFWNPTTKKFYRRKVKPNYQHKKKYIVKNNKLFAQAQIFDPTEGTLKDIGDPYETKSPGSTTVNINEKVELHKQKAEATAAVKKVAGIQSPKFRATVSEQLKKSMGDDWQYLQPFEKEQTMFDEMDRQIKESYPKKRIAYDDKKGGWYDLDSGKLIRKYDDPYRTKKGVARSFGYHRLPFGN